MIVTTAALTFEPQEPATNGHAVTNLPYKELFYPLGFPIEIVTNHKAVLDSAAQLWSYPYRLLTAPAMQLRIVISETPHTPQAPPPTPLFNTQKYLLSLVADTDNHATCDLSAGFGFAHFTLATLEHPLYLQYHFLDAMALAMISAYRAPALHAACVSFNEVGFLFCGPSGAGKSTLAYACARAGFTYTSDDASYLLANSSPPQVLGRSHTIRFRPHARELFPELQHRDLTPRLAGKPSIEIPTSDLPAIQAAPKAAIHHLILLDRHSTRAAMLSPVSPALALQDVYDNLYPTPEVRRDQIVAIAGLHTVTAHRLRYSSLDEAIDCLKSMAQDMSPSL